MSKRPPCPDCQGTGTVEIERGINVITETCKTCGGYGYLLAHGDYITYEQFNSIIQAEKLELFRLLYKTVWYLGLRISEVLVIRPKHINVPQDSIRLQKHGMPAGTDTIRITRTSGQQRYLPLPKWLKQEILDYVRRAGIKDEDRIFARHRTTLAQHLGRYGFTIGGKTRVSVEALRRGFGIWYLSKGGHIEDLKVIYDQSQISLTQSYLAIDGRAALTNFAKFQHDNSPHGKDSPQMSDAYEKQKLKLCEILGGAKCVRCGAKDLRLLVFDHVQGGGATEMKKFGGNFRMIAYYVNNPEIAKQSLQVLCANCNSLKRHENREFYRQW
jgi:hypothetical protein